MSAIELTYIGFVPITTSHTEKGFNARITIHKILTALTECVRFVNFLKPHQRIKPLHCLVNWLAARLKCLLA